MNGRSSGAASESAHKLDVAKSYRQLRRLRKMVKRAESLVCPSSPIPVLELTRGAGIQLGIKKPCSKRGLDAD
jgi:hypothetical protein